MRSYKFWNILSRVSALLLGFYFIISRFFIKDKHNYLDILISIGVSLLVIFLFSELVKYILRKNNK